MALRLGDIAPDFTADTTAGPIIFMNGSVIVGPYCFIRLFTSLLHPPSSAQLHRSIHEN